MHQAPQRLRTETVHQRDGTYHHLAIAQRTETTMISRPLASNRITYYGHQEGSPACTVFDIPPRQSTWTVRRGFSWASYEFSSILIKGMCNIKYRFVTKNHWRDKQSDYTKRNSPSSPSDPISKRHRDRSRCGITRKLGICHISTPLWFRTKEPNTWEPARRHMFCVDHLQRQTGSSLDSHRCSLSTRGNAKRNMRTPSLMEIHHPGHRDCFRSVLF